MTSTLEVASRTEGRWKARDVWCAGAGVVSLALAVGAASTVAVPVGSDLGLVAVLPYPFWVGVLLLNVAFVVALRGDAAGPARRLVMLWLVVVLVLVLFGTAAFVTDVPRGEVAFRHLGIADALSLRRGLTRTRMRTLTGRVSSRCWRRCLGRRVLIRWLLLCGRRCSTWVCGWLLWVC